MKSSEQYLWDKLASIRERMDAKGVGKPCGQGWISKDRECHQKGTPQQTRSAVAMSKVAAKGRQLAREGKTEQLERLRDALDEGWYKVAEGFDNDKVFSYLDALLDYKKVGEEISDHGFERSTRNTLQEIKDYSAKMNVAMLEAIATENEEAAEIIEDYNPKLAAKHRNLARRAETEIDLFDTLPRPRNMTSKGIDKLLDRAVEMEDRDDRIFAYEHVEGILRYLPSQSFEGQRAYLNNEYEKDIRSRLLGKKPEYRLTRKGDVWEVSPLSEDRPLEFTIMDDSQKRAYEAARDEGERQYALEEATYFPKGKRSLAPQAKALSRKLEMEASAQNIQPEQQADIYSRSYDLMIDPEGQIKKLRSAVAGAKRAAESGIGRDTEKILDLYRPAAEALREIDPSLSRQVQEAIRPLDLVEQEVWIRSRAGLERLVNTAQETGDRKKTLRALKEVAAQYEDFLKTIPEGTDLAGDEFKEHKQYLDGKVRELRRIMSKQPRTDSLPPLELIHELQDRIAWERSEAVQRRSKAR